MSFSAIASEKAASAREAGWEGSNSRSSEPYGWLSRRPSRRATVSVPSIDVGTRPASRAATRIRFAAGSSPSAPTIWASSSRIVTRRVGSAGAAARLAPGGERVRQLSAGQRVGRPEARRVVSEDRGRRDNPNLGICPRERNLLPGDDGRGRQRLNRPSGTCGEAEGKENRRGQGKSTPHTLCIGHQRAGLSTGRGRRGSRGYIWAHDSPGYPHVPRRRDRLRRRRARGSAAAGTGDGGSNGDGRQGIARSAPRQAGVRQRLVVLVKHVSGRGGCLRALGEAAGRCVPLPRPERG